MEAKSKPDAIVATPSSSGLVTISGLALKVQSWLDGTEANYGWAIISDNTNGWDVDSSENSTTSDRPQLSVTFTPAGGVPDNTGLALWAENNGAAPEYNEFDSTSFGTEGNAASLGEWTTIRGAEPPTRDEAIVIGVEFDTHVISGQIWNGSSWTSFSINDLGWAKDDSTHVVDVAYESNSGRRGHCWG